LGAEPPGRLLKTEKNEAPQEPPAEDLEEFEPPKSNTRIWVFGAICLAVIALGIFISYRISR
jgi:hypothetical protein